MKEILLGTTNSDDDEGANAKNQNLETEDGTKKSEYGKKEDRKKKKSSTDSKNGPKCEKEEKEGGASIFPLFRSVLKMIASNVSYDIKQEIEIAIPSLATLLLPELPDYLRPSISFKTRLFMTHLINSPGGTIDTMKILWNKIIGKYSSEGASIANGAL